ncbi:cyclophilin-like fold protein [Streptomyces sp. AS02]|uniref:cyclophilin-like fold protein n=1 Tax=Streptomyces sp. AS02 TaxID=2938946 RepID=UPI0020215446|nr:cyclophilin-like fold protein [Streptomyces sp. AS02]MCL8011302.1 cyclophilin-like fold protein [Streptomyces sp. AS02]
MTTVSSLDPRRSRRARLGWALPFVLAFTFVAAACTSDSGDTAAPSGSSTASSSSASSAPASGGSSSPSEGAADSTPIRITIGDTVLSARLWDNATARDLIRQLPVTVEFSDLMNAEKAGHLPQELSTDGMPEGDDPRPRDIGYYAPWGNLVFYYGDVDYWDGIVRIGQFDGDVDAIADQPDGFRARVELAR